MNKVKTLDDLRKMRETLRSTLDIREKSNHPEQMVQIRISMATCGIAVMNPEPNFHPTTIQISPI